MLKPREISTLLLFNSKAEELIDSSLVKEKKEINPRINFVWKLNEDTKNMDFKYGKINHTDEALKSFILTLRLFMQYNETISIRNMNSLYENMDIHIKYNQIIDTLIYGNYAHLKKDKIEKITRWKGDILDWDVIFFQFQDGLHEFIDCIRNMKFLNKLVLKDYS